MQLVDILITMNNLYPDSNTGWMGEGCLLNLNRRQSQARLLTEVNLPPAMKQLNTIYQFIEYATCT